MAAGKVLGVLSIYPLKPQPTRRLRTSALLAAGVLTLGIAGAGCTIDGGGSMSVNDAVDRVLGPTPPQTLLDLAALARTDAAEAGVSADFAALRTSQEEALIAEAKRICGTFPDGSAPGSCDIDDTALTAEARPEGSDPVAEALKATVAAMGKAPEESRDLLATQASKLAALLPEWNPDDAAGATDATDPVLGLSHGLVTTAQAAQGVDESVVGPLRDLIATEDGIIYGLGQAQAFISADQAQGLSDLLGRHKAARAALGTIFADYEGADAGSTSAAASPTNQPVAAPGYDFSAVPEPHDAESAQAFVQAVKDAEPQSWIATLSKVGTSDVSVVLACGSAYLS